MKKIIIGILVCVCLILGFAFMNQTEYLGEALLLDAETDYEALGILSEPQYWEDGMRTTGDEGTYEWWYTDAEFDDGTTIVAVFFTKNGFDVPGKAHPRATLDITYPDGTKIYRKIEAEEGQVLEASKEYCDVEIGSASLKYVDGNYELKFVDNDLEYELFMESTLPMWRPETGHWYFGDDRKDFFAWFVAQPSSTVTGKLIVSGEEKALKGTGYHDHNWGNIPMNEVINHWYWGRAKVEDYDIIACDIIAEEAYGNTRLPVIMIAKNGEILEDDQSKTMIQRDETHAHEFTEKFMDNRLTYIQPSDNGISYVIEYKREKDIVSVSLLDRLEQPKKILAKLIGANPTYVRVLGEVTLTVNDNGILKTYESEGLWEQMFFGKNKNATISSDQN